MLATRVLGPCELRIESGWMDMSIADKAKGKLKEAVGSVTGDVDLRREGKAQWHKGHHQAQADEARAMTEKHELEAELFEHEERRHQRIRDDVPGDVPGESRRDLDR
jgi:uncharacterized protein YjbJ (UPF0337 family)